MYNVATTLDTCIRDFNISNLRGIKRRMIDVGKITFPFCKSLKMHNKNNLGTKNPEFYADFKFIDADLKKFFFKSYS
jgi:hypothetical protein